MNKEYNTADWLKMHLNCSLEQNVHISFGSNLLQLNIPAFHLNKLGIICSS